MVCDFSGVPTHHLGAVCEICPCMVGLKACNTATLFTVTLEFREQLIHEISLLCWD